MKGFQILLCVSVISLLMATSVSSFLIRLEKLTTCVNSVPGPSEAVVIVNSSACATLPSLAALGSMRTTCLNNTSDSNYTLTAYLASATCEEGVQQLHDAYTGSQCVVGIFRVGDVAIRVDCGYEQHPHLYDPSSSSSSTGTNFAVASSRVSPFLILALMLFVLLRPTASG